VATKSLMFFVPHDFFILIPAHPTIQTKIALFARRTGKIVIR
jgi:hypothetical protein